MLPFETILAIFPSVGATQAPTLGLRTPTILHCAALEALGVDLEGVITRKNAYLAAWILTLDPVDLRDVVTDSDRSRTLFNEWMRRFETPRKGLFGRLARPSKKRVTDAPSHDEVVRAVAGTIKTAFLPAIAPKGEAQETRVRNGRQGLGWPLEMAEWLASEYGQSLDAALETPLATALALIAAARQRNGLEHGGPDYWERRELPGELAKLRKMKEAGQNG